MALRLALTAPLVPSQNQLLRKHWSARRRLQRKLTEDFHYTALEQTPVEDRSAFPLPKARVEIVRFSCGRSPDPDNLVASAKLILDALVDAGLLQDDSPECLELAVDWQRVKQRALQRCDVQVQAA